MHEALQKTWDTIADSWSNLRVRPWREVLEFSKDVKKGVVLDIGCGNCRNLIPFIGNGIECIGMDFSKGMIKQSKIFLKKRNLKANLVIGISANLPFKNESVSTVICNAVLHDIIQKEDISRSLKEIRRVAKNNCEVLMSVWNRCQKRFIWPLIKSFFSGNYADIWVDWNYHGKIYKRFYHLYTKKELRNEIEKVELKVEKGWNDEKGNIWLLITKWE